jgi:hypothetical protein
LTKGLEPYPASPTWTPTTPARSEDFPVAWVVLGALAGAAVLALALRRLGRLPFAGEEETSLSRRFGRLRASLERQSGGYRPVAKAA